MLASDCAYIRSAVKFLVLLALPSTIFAQVLPKEGGKLNYRIIGFSFPGIINDTKGKFEIAEGYYKNIDSFRENIFFTQKCDTNRLVAEVPAFGKQYTWTIKMEDGHKVRLHHFSTLSVPDVDTTHRRLRILEKAKKYRDAYVFVDGNRVLYDMQGNPVWFLPDDLNDEKMEIRDLKASPQGTITYLIGNHPHEINYDGTVLWEAPDNGAVSGSNIEGYHHEFTRFSTGNYMLLGNEYVTVDAAEMKNNRLVVTGEKNVLPQDTMWRKLPRNTLGTIIEYDHAGNVVWSWKTSDHVYGSDLIYHKRVVDRPDLSLHENSFFFDEKEHTIYYSYRNISRVIKIKYPEGTILNTYGPVYTAGNPNARNKMFCGQHSCRLSKSGDLYLYDNNTCDFTGMSKIVMMKQPKDEHDSLEVKWEYTCSIDYKRDSMAYSFPMGGSVLELPDNSLLACMGGNYSKVFIVNMNKKILWSALPEIWNKDRKRWEEQYSFHASILTSKEDLEHLIWGEKLETQ